MKALINLHVLYGRKGLRKTKEKKLVLEKTVEATEPSSCEEGKIQKVAEASEGGEEKWGSALKLNHLTITWERATASWKRAMIFFNSKGERA